MTTRQVRERLLSQKPPDDIKAAMAENGGLAPAPLCWVCLETVDEVPEIERLLWEDGRIREPNLPIVTCDLGHKKHPRGAVLHTRCKPGTARWARHQNADDEDAKTWLRIFGYNPDEMSGLTEEDMAKKARSSKAKAEKSEKAKKRDARLPAAGTMLKREYKGTIHEVRVNEKSFSYDGEQYPSLTAVAKKITGYPAISGPEFFKAALAEKTGAAA